MQSILITTYRYIYVQPTKAYYETCKNIANLVRSMFIDIIMLV